MRLVKGDRIKRQFLRTILVVFLDLSRRLKRVFLILVAAIYLLAVIIA